MAQGFGEVRRRCDAPLDFLFHVTDEAAVRRAIGFFVSCHGPKCGRWICSDKSRTFRFQSAEHSALKAALKVVELLDNVRLPFGVVLLVQIFITCERARDRILRQPHRLLLDDRLILVVVQAPTSIEWLSKPLSVPAFDAAVSRRISPAEHNVVRARNGVETWVAATGVTRINLPADREAVEVRYLLARFATADRLGWPPNIAPLIVL